MYTLITTKKLNDDFEDLLRGTYYKKFITLKGAIKFLNNNHIDGVIKDKNNTMIYIKNTNSFKLYTEKDLEQGYEVPYNIIPLSETSYYRTDYFMGSEYKPLKIIKFAFNEIARKNKLQIHFDIGRNNKGFYIYAKAHYINDIESIMNQYTINFNTIKENYESLLFSNNIEEIYYDIIYNDKYKPEMIEKAKELYEQRLEKGFWKYLGSE